MDLIIGVDLQQEADFKFRSNHVLIALEFSMPRTQSYSPRVTAQVGVKLSLSSRCTRSVYMVPHHYWPSKNVFTSCPVVTVHYQYTSEQGVCRGNAMFLHIHHAPKDQPNKHGC